MGGKSNQPTQIPETPEEKALAQIAAERWADYQKNFVPLENRYIAHVANIGEGEKQSVEGQAAAQTQAKIGASVGAARSALRARQINPASGASLSTQGNLRNIEGRALGLGNAQAREGVTSARLQGLENIVDIGTGVKNTAQSGFANAAQEASQIALNNALAREQEQAANEAAEGNLIGLGASGLYHTKKNGWGWSIDGQPPDTTG